MKIAHLLLLSLLCSSAFASHDQSAFPSSIKCTIGEVNVEVEAACDQNGNLVSLTVKWPGVLGSVPKEELSDLQNDIDLGTLRYVATVSTNQTLKESSRDEQFAISFACGPTTTNIENGKTVYSRNEVQFEFEAGKYHRRLRSVTYGNQKSLWRELQKNPGEKEFLVGKRKGARNPVGYYSEIDADEEDTEQGADGKTPEAPQLPH